MSPFFEPEGGGDDTRKSSGAVQNSSVNHVLFIN